MCCGYVDGLAEQRCADPVSAGALGAVHRMVRASEELFETQRTSNCSGRADADCDTQGRHSFHGSDRARFSLPAHALALVLVEGHFDVELQFAFIKGLCEEAVRRNDLGALQCWFVEIRAQKNHRQVQLTTQNIGGLDPVHPTLDSNVHQGQCGPVLARQQQRFLCRSGHAAHLVATAYQTISQVLGDDRLVFHDEQRGGIYHRISIGPEPVRRAAWPAR